MIDKNMLDNLTAKEIKEMINAKELNIQELNTSALQKLMSYEIDMLCFDEGDLDLICKCSDLLDKINPCPMSNEEFMAIVKKTEKEHVVITDNKSAVRRAPRARVLLKRIAVIAAVVIILSTATVGIASTLGVDIIGERYKIARQEDGSRTDIDGFTFFNVGEVEYYSSIEEMIKNENSTLIYPTKFPDGIYIKTIKKHKSYDNTPIIHISTNSLIGITMQFTNQLVENINPNTIVFNDITYYIQDGGDTWVAGCLHNGVMYSITAKTREDLIIILENMKETEK